MPPADPTVLSLIVDDLKEVKDGVARIEGAMSQKADKADIVRLQAADTALDERLQTLEAAEDRRKEAARVHRERDERSFFSRKNKWAVIATAATVICTMLLAGAAVASLIVQLSH